VSEAPDIAAIYRAESGRVLATLIRLLGGFDAAEEALHDAFAAAAERWPKEGVPRNPRAWLVSAGRFRAIDRIRRRARFDEMAPQITHEIEMAAEEGAEPMEEQTIRDDQLRLIFTCCHPALAPDAQVALTLREICGLTTEQIAAAFLVPPPTLAQRIVRAKSKIRDARIPYAVPEPEELPSRLDAALHAIYLVFNAGYSAPADGADLAAEAIRLGRLLVELLADAEAVGLLALMVLNESRRAARTSPQGELILIADQDRTLWDREAIEEGVDLANRALAAGGKPGPFALQAAIAAEHARVMHPAETDWHRIAALYDRLVAAVPTPIVALNRAVAVAERDGPDAGLNLIEPLAAELGAYHLFHSTRGELLRRMGRVREAAAAYARALDLAATEADRRFLSRRLAEVQQS
jgi:RNA polymerase sigma-70 factor (ECF subfamily)